jgi:uncharacterized membrane protein
MPADGPDAPAPGIPPAAGPAAAGDDADEPGIDRLITLSDGVVAIALTLLILDIRVPSGLRDPDSVSALADALSGTVANWISYLISFYVIAQFWVVHHKVFRGIRAQSGGLAGWNFVFLFTISVMPFTSALVGEYPDNPLSVIIFSANLILANLATRAMLIFGRRRHLLTSRGEAVLAEFRSLQGVIDLSFYVISIPVALVSPDLGKVCWLGLALSTRIVAVINRIRGWRPAEGDGR